MTLSGVGVGEDHAPLIGRADTRIQATCLVYAHCTHTCFRPLMLECGYICISKERRKKKTGLASAKLHLLKTATVVDGLHERILKQKVLRKPCTISLV